MSVDLLPLLLLCPILAFVAGFDLTQMRIPNVLVLSGLLLFASCIPLIGLSEALARATVFAAVFAICISLFACRMIGGGDAKMIPVVFLFIPSAQSTSYALILGWSLLGGILIVRGLRWGLQRDGAAWVSMRPGADFPMGVSIALSGLAFLGWTLSGAP